MVNVFGQKKLFKDSKSGGMHLIMFYGFIILQFGAIELIIKGFIKGFEFPFGEAHHYFSLSQEMTTLLVLLAVLYAFYRRYIEKLKRLKRGLKSGWSNIIIVKMRDHLTETGASVTSQTPWMPSYVFGNTKANKELDNPELKKLQRQMIQFSN